MGFWRRHGAMGMGPGQRPRPWRRASGSGDATVDRQPVRRHGSRRRDASNRSCAGLARCAGAGVTHLFARAGRLTVERHAYHHHRTAADIGGGTATKVEVSIDEEPRANARNDSGPSRGHPVHRYGGVAKPRDGRFGNREAPSGGIMSPDSAGSRHHAADSCHFFSRDGCDRRGNGGDRIGVGVGQHRCRRRAVQG